MTKIIKAKEGWNLISQKVYKDYRKLNDAAEFPLIKKLFNKKDIRGEKVLDIGCGLGEYSLWFAQKGAYVTAVDLSEEMINEVKRKNYEKRLKIKTALGNIQNLHFLKRNSFDFILAMSMLDVIKDYNRAIKELSRLIKKDGVLLLSLWHPLKGHWQKDKQGNLLSFSMKDYFKTGLNPEKWVINNKEIFVESYHRTLEQYSKALADNSFVIKRIYQPRPSKDYKKLDKIWYKKSMKIPYFWVFEAKKNGV